MDRRRNQAPPAGWQDFEDLCLKLWRPRLVDAKRHGRQGQPHQAGVDVFGRLGDTPEWARIQYKLKSQLTGGSLSPEEIEAEDAGRR